MNLFDAEHDNGPLMREKPRAATETEAKFYVTWLRERRGLRLFDSVELHSRGIGGGRNPHLVYWAATFGKCLKSGGWQNGEMIAPEYQEGAYSILIPGHDQLAPRVTMETLDESGEVVASQTLPVEPKKGGVIWDKAAVRKACGPVAKPAKGKRAKVAAPIPVAAPAVEPVEAQEAVAPTCDVPEPAIAPSAAPAVDLDAITARLDALEQALATLSAGQGATVEAEPVAERPKRTPAHERAIRRAWAERRAFLEQRKLAGEVKAELKAAWARQEELATALQLAKDEQALDKQALSEAYARAEQFARRGNQHRERRLATARRARRMIGAARARASEAKALYDRAQVWGEDLREKLHNAECRATSFASAAKSRDAEIARLKRDMADPSQPERASDIARLVRERDEARTALAAVTARAERAEQGLHSMADRFEGLVSRVTRAEAALRQKNVA